MTLTIGMKGHEKCERRPLSSSVVRDSRSVIIWLAGITMWGHEYESRVGGITRGQRTVLAVDQDFIFSLYGHSLTVCNSTCIKASLFLNAIGSGGRSTNIIHF